VRGRVAQRVFSFGFFIHCANWILYLEANRKEITQIPVSLNKEGKKLIIALELDLAISSSA